jgi:5-(carboxyamino)imidazole ribonucleotide synthase
MKVAIVGCGQLARMMAMSGLQMGIECSFLAGPEEDVRCVRGLGRVLRLQPGAKPAQILAELGHPDVVTVERESVDVDLLEQFTSHCAVYPRPDTIRKLQHRLREKQLIDGLQLDTAPFRGAHTVTQVADAADQLGLPVVVKTASNGYDGRGQTWLRSSGDVSAFCSEERRGDWLVESGVAFEREISLLAARSSTGELAFYPATENRHREGILETSVAPATDLSATLQQRARDYALALLEDLDYVGVLAMECFVVGDRLLINELAPRVHNSGHWTLRSEATSQFENHLRAILGLPLGDTGVTRYEGIINILGNYNAETTLRRLTSRASLVDYDKLPGPSRKLGHVHVSGNDYHDLIQEMSSLQEHLNEARCQGQAHGA